jgi:hypothetical protein
MEWGGVPGLVTWQTARNGGKSGIDLWKAASTSSVTETSTARSVARTWAGRVGPWKPEASRAERRFQSWTEPSAAIRIVLRFVTPLRLKVRDRFDDRPGFRTLAFNMLRRVLELAHAHVPGAAVDWSFRPFLEQAAGVQVVDRQLVWQEHERWSNRQQTAMKLGGVVGTMVLEGDLAPFGPLLRTAEIVHVGKGRLSGSDRSRSWQLASPTGGALPRKTAALSVSPPEELESLHTRRRFLMPRTDGRIAKTQISEGIAVRAPGLIVDAEPMPAGHLQAVALEAMAPADDYAARESAALEAEGLKPHHSPLRLRVSRPAAMLESVAAPAAPRISTASSIVPHIELSVDADPGDHVLARVQKGKVVQWYLPILPHPVHALRAVGPGSGPVTMRFAIPAPMEQPPGSHTLEAAATAGAATSEGIVSFFKFKAITSLIGGAEAKIIQFIAEKIEKRLKEEGIKDFDPQSPQFDRILSTDELKAMGSRGRMALYIHGIFSSIDGAFSAVRNDADLMQALRAKYPGGIIGYDHWTISRRPQENAEMLLSELPPGLDLDLICHSRGGLITRAVLELESLSKLSHLQTFRKAVFVASANQGSALAVEANWNRLINIFIGLSSLFGGNVGVSVDLLLGLLKVLAHGAFALPSIKDLQPGSDLIQSLNAGHDPRLEHASLVHANFDHAQSPLLKAADFAVDTVFGGTANDLVVPFPDAIAFEPTAASVSVNTIQSYNSDGTGQGKVLHTNYFSQPEVKTILREL